MKIARSGLLNALESIAPGVASREMIDQGTCAVFMGDRVCSYNDEIFCQYKLEDGLDLTGAVPMAPLRSILHKMTEETVEMSISGGELLVRGKGGREVGLLCDPKILLPISKVETPEKFKKLPPSFAVAVTRVALCASTDSGLYDITCVRMTSEYIEATDNSQAIRYDMKLPVPEPALIRATSLAHVKLAMPKSMAMTRSWVHFRNGLGLQISIRKDAAEKKAFPDLAKSIAFTGKTIVLPKSLAEACERAEVFSSDDAETNMIKIVIEEGKRLRLRSDGAMGWYKEPKKIDYTGPPLTFMISPGLLSALVREGYPTKVDGRRLIMNSGSFSYVVALEEPVEVEKETASEDTDE